MQGTGPQAEDSEIIIQPLLRRRLGRVPLRHLRGGIGAAIGLRAFV